MLDITSRLWYYIYRGKMHQMRYSKIELYLKKCIFAKSSNKKVSPLITGKEKKMKQPIIYKIEWLKSYNELVNLCYKYQDDTKNTCWTFELLFNGSLIKKSYTTQNLIDFMYDDIESLNNEEKAVIYNINNYQIQGVLWHDNDDKKTGKEYRYCFDWYELGID